jgi:hypothetical protein
MGATPRPWWSDPDPDPAVLHRLYVDDGRTEREIARLLGISQQHVAASLAEAGIERRTLRRPCPVDAETLADLHSAPDATVASLSRRFDAAPATVRRWLADAGLVPPVPPSTTGDSAASTSISDLPSQRWPGGSASRAPGWSGNWS